ncbi:fimbrial protein [Providencia sp.]|uniref:fimbrial protein n=1 Tax=Providencia sp. TaxID=589 RepID=UPI000E9AE5EC|nr:type 1 fimbrial protein [Providencia sp.]HBO21391.1 type 1 fimbrial protein [Providencia sp.]
MKSKILFIALFGFLASHLSLAATNNVKVKGSLVNAPCVVMPADKNVEVDFGDIRLLDIYDSSFQFPRKELTLVLSNCDLTIAKKMKVKFSGAEHNQLLGFLALSGTDNQGLGIGVELVDGTAVKINQFSSLLPLIQAGKNELRFNTFLKATPESISNKQIKAGHIVATATFLFEYE